MQIRTVALNSIFMVATTFGFGVNPAISSELTPFNVAEFNRQLAAINTANIPASVKDKLTQDMTNTLIEQVRQSHINDATKQRLISDLENATRI